jgi:hypothetical protein
MLLLYVTLGCRSTFSTGVRADTLTSPIALFGYAASYKSFVPKKTGNNKPAIYVTHTIARHIASQHPAAFVAPWKDFWNRRSAAPCKDFWNTLSATGAI